MGLDVTTLTSAVEDKEIDLDFEGLKIHLTFDINAHTPALEREWMLQDRLNPGAVGPGLVSIITGVVKSWDLKGDVKFSYEPDELDSAGLVLKKGAVVEGSGVLVASDTMFPIVAEKVMYIPTRFLDAVVDAIGVASRPK